MFNHALAYVMSVLVADQKDEKGASAVEYALVVGMVVAVVFVAITALGGKISGYIDDIPL